MTCLTVDIVTIFLLRQANSAVLFPLILINPPPIFFGNALLALPRRRIHFALSKNLVCVLVPYNTNYVRFTQLTFLAYSRQVLAAACFSSFIMSGPSNITTSTLGMMSYCSSVASSRHRTMSYLVSCLSLPLSEIMLGMVGSRERNIH